MTWYMLDENRQVIPAPSVSATADRKRVGMDEFPEHGIRVSTVFLGLDHRFGDVGPPLVFETMVFPLEGWGDLACERYSTWEQAEAGHRAWCDKVRAGEIRRSEEEQSP